MRKLAVCAIAATLAVALVPGPATGAQAKKQEVSGSLVVGLTHTDAGCFAGAHRRVAILTQEAVNGVSGYHFDVDPATAGKPFVLEPTGGQGTPDLDIIFYTHFGTPEDVAADPAGAGAPPVIGFETHAVGGETGIVPPKEYPKAIVCFNAATAPAANVTFTYTAGKGVKPPK
ncbi:MAG TPA: hypothetical protein VNC78_04545 [Actinomycetota bacterium]|nr:hypothetical protein [Actinomycetota bacterium]